MLRKGLLLPFSQLRQMQGIARGAEVVEEEIQGLGIRAVLPDGLHQSHQLRILPSVYLANREPAR